MLGDLHRGRPGIEETVWEGQETQQPSTPRLNYTRRPSIDNREDTSSLWEWQRNAGAVTKGGFEGRVKRYSWTPRHYAICRHEHVPWGMYDKKKMTAAMETATNEMDRPLHECPEEATNEGSVLGESLLGNTCELHQTREFSGDIKEAENCRRSPHQHDKPGI